MNRGHCVVKGILDRYRLCIGSCWKKISRHFRASEMRLYLSLSLQLNISQHLLLVFIAWLRMRMKSGGKREKYVLELFEKERECEGRAESVTG